MPINDDSKVLFSSTWGIEQVLYHGTATVTANSSNNIKIFNWSDVNINYMPRVIAVWKSTADVRWQMAGASNGNDGILQVILKPDGLYVGTDMNTFAAQVRFTVYRDKVEV